MLPVNIYKPFSPLSDLVNSMLYHAFDAVWGHFVIRVKLTQVSQPKLRVGNRINYIIVH